MGLELFCGTGCCVPFLAFPWRFRLSSQKQSWNGETKHELWCKASTWYPREHPWKISKIHCNRVVIPSPESQSSQASRFAKTREPEPTNGAAASLQTDVVWGFVPNSSMTVGFHGWFFGWSDLLMAWLMEGNYVLWCCCPASPLLGVLIWAKRIWVRCDPGEREAKPLHGRSLVM